MGTRSCWTPRRSLALAVLIGAGLGACSGDEASSPGVRQVQLAVEQTQLAKGTTAQLTVTAVLEDGTRQDLTTRATIVSSDPSCVSVIAGGLQAVAPGEVTVTATWRGKSASVHVEVTPAILQQLELAPQSLDLAAGVSTEITATGLFTDDTHQDLTSLVTWSSDASTIAKVAGGVVTAVAPGSAVVEAALHGVSATVAVTVRPAVLTSLAAFPASGSLPVGVSQTVVLTGTFSDDRTRNLTSTASWSSSAPEVVAVEAAGRLRAVSPGTATIAAVVGDRSVEIPVVVTPAVPVSLSLDPPVVFLPAGVATSISAFATLTDETMVDVTADATWTTSAANVAVVGTTGGEAGRVTAQSTGVALISATFAGITGSTDVTVTPAELSAIRLTPAGAHEVASGLTVRLAAQGIYTDASELDLTRQVTWISRNPQVATVSTTGETAGLVQARAPGEAEIVARLSGVQATTVVAVTPAVVSSLAISAGGGSVPVGLGLQARATARRSDGVSLDVTELATWSSSLGLVFEVDTAGRVVGVAEGKATLRATYEGQTDDLEITVTPPILVKIAVSAPTPVIPLWRSLQPAARGTFSDGTSRDVSGEVTWSSSDESVARVEWDGWIYAQGEGEVTVTASAQEGDAFGAIDLTILPSSPSSFELRLDAPGAIEVGTPLRLQAVASYDDGSSADVSYWAYWWSEDESVVQLLREVPGEAAAAGAGTTWVYADLDGWQTGIEITVAPAPGD